MNSPDDVPVEVALGLRPFGYVGAESYSAVEFETPWVDRPKVSLRVKRVATVADVLDEVGMEMELQPDPAFGPPFKRLSDGMAAVGFWQDAPYEGAGKGKPYWPTVGPDGMVRWDQYIFSVPLSELLAAQAAGVFGADPTRIYLVPQVSAGGFGIFDWGAFPEFLETSIELLVLLGGVTEGMKATRTGSVWALGTLSKAVTRLRNHLQSRRADLDDVTELVSSVNLDAARLAALLGCSTEDAEALRLLTHREMPSDSALIVAAFVLASGELALTGGTTPTEGSREFRVLRAIATEVAASRTPHPEEVRRILNTTN